MKLPSVLKIQQNNTLGNYRHSFLVIVVQIVVNTPIPQNNKTQTSS